METSQLICCANRLTGYYMRATLALNGLRMNSWFALHKIPRFHLVSCANFVFPQNFHTRKLGEILRNVVKNGIIFDLSKEAFKTYIFLGLHHITNLL